MAGVHGAWENEAFDRITYRLRRRGYSVTDVAEITGEPRQKAVNSFARLNKKRRSQAAT